MLNFPNNQNDSSATGLKVKVGAWLTPAGGALYSLSSSAFSQPGSAKSTKPSASLSIPSLHADFGASCPFTCKSK